MCYDNDDPKKIRTSNVMKLHRCWLFSAFAQAQRRWYPLLSLFLVTEARCGQLFYYFILVYVRWSAVIPECYNHIRQQATLSALPCPVFDAEMD